MAFIFPSIKSLKLDFPTSTELSLPPVTKEDIAWAKHMKKNGEHLNYFRAEAMAQIAEGNFRRFFWLTKGMYSGLHGRMMYSLAPSLAKPVLAETDNPEFKSSHAAFILQGFPKLEKPQYAILNYLVMDGRQTDEHYSESRVIDAAISTMGQGNCYLTELETSIDHTRKAVRKGNKMALAYLINEHYTKASEDDKDLMRREIIPNLYWIATSENNVEILDTLHDLVPMPETYAAGFVTADSSGCSELAEWYLAKGIDKDQAFLIAIQREKYGTALRLIEKYEVDPNLQDGAALKKCLDHQHIKGIEFLIDQGADTEALANQIADKNPDDSNSFDKKLSRLFAKSATAQKLIKWNKEDHTTILREHQTANFTNRMLFFFDEGQVAQTITKVDKDVIVNERIWSFDEFRNQELLKEAAAQLKQLKGDPSVHHKFQAAPKKIEPHSNAPAVVLKTPRRG